ncbi:MAG: hypothetical protein ACOX0U_05355 [Oscillospiraceae bacterium]|jgi:hypothetical protein
MKRVIAASLLTLLLCTGLAACGKRVVVVTPTVTPTATPLFTADVTPGENTMPGSGVPTASPASS